MLQTWCWSPWSGRFPTWYFIERVNSGKASTPLTTMMTNLKIYLEISGSYVFMFIISWSTSQPFPVNLGVKQKNPTFASGNKHPVPPVASGACEACCGFLSLGCVPLALVCLPFKTLGTVFLTTSYEWHKIMIAKWKRWRSEIGGEKKLGEGTEDQNQRLCKIF